MKAINNRPKNPEIMELSSFDISNNEIGILFYQSEAGLIYKASKPIFEIRLLYSLPKHDHNYYNIFPMMFLCFFQFRQQELRNLAGVLHPFWDLGRPWDDPGPLGSTRETSLGSRLGFVDLRHFRPTPSNGGKWKNHLCMFVYHF